MTSEVKSVTPDTQASPQMHEIVARLVEMQQAELKHPTTHNAVIPIKWSRFGITPQMIEPMKAILESKGFSIAEAGLVLDKKTVVGWHLKLYDKDKYNTEHHRLAHQRYLEGGGHPDNCLHCKLWRSYCYNVVFFIFYVDIYIFYLFEQMSEAKAASNSARDQRALARNRVRGEGDHKEMDANVQAMMKELDEAKEKHKQYGIPTSQQRYRMYNNHVPNLHPKDPVTYATAKLLITRTPSSAMDLATAEHPTTYTIRPIAARSKFELGMR